MMNQAAIYAELLEYISNTEVIDCHEHLISEERALAETVDFSLLIDQYCSRDFESAGMRAEEKNALYHSNTPPEQKWKIFSEYYPIVADTAYFKASRIVLRHDFGVEELTKDNYQNISAQIQARRQPGYYKKILKDCRIRTVLNNTDHPDIPAGSYFHPSNEQLKTVVRVPNPPDREAFLSPGTFFSGIKSTTELDERAAAYVSTVAGIGAKGIKVMNDIPYIPATAAESTQELEQLLCGRHNGVGVRVYWYVLDRILDYAAKIDMPVAVHTGYWGDFRLQSPEKYLPWIDAHPNNRFDLFHLGYPYVKSSLMLAKARPNVVLNLCWTYIISQQFAFDSLCQIFDLLPLNKVLGFGGDFHCIERVYGHRIMMNETMAKALAAKVTDGTLSMERAKRWAQAMLVDNPKAFYNV